MDQTAFDPAAFLAALQSAAVVAPKPVTLPGVGACFKRALTTGDVLDAEDHRQALEAAGLKPDRKANMAIGLAQTLCGPTGQPVLNASDPAHIALLTALPWSVIKGLLGDDADGADEKNA
jgi:hypothetical protein